MQIIVAFALCFFATSVVQAQSARIERVDILQPGIFEKQEEPRIITDKNISVGQRTEMRVRLVRNTTVIPARENTIFGVELAIRGSPDGQSAPVRVVWRYPHPGIIDPRTSAPKFIDEYMDVRSVGTTTTYYWTLGGPHTQVPGVWTFELWQDNRRLVSQNFTLVRP